MREVQRKQSNQNREHCELNPATQSRPREFPDEIHRAQHRQHDGQVMPLIDIVQAHSRPRMRDHDNDCRRCAQEQKQSEGTKTRPGRRKPCPSEDAHAGQHENKDGEAPVRCVGLGCRAQTQPPHLQGRHCRGNRSRRRGPRGQIRWVICWKERGVIDEIGANKGQGDADEPDRKQSVPPLPPTERRPAGGHPDAQPEAEDQHVWQSARSG